MKKRLLTLIFTLFVGTFSVFAQMSDPTSWTFSQKKTGDNEYALTFKATIQPGWTVYSMSVSYTHLDVYKRQVYTEDLKLGIRNTNL